MKGAANYSVDRIYMNQLISNCLALDSTRCLSVDRFYLKDSMVCFDFQLKNCPVSFYYLNSPDKGVGLMGNGFVENTLNPYQDGGFVIPKRFGGG